MALSADAPRTYELGKINELPVAASTTIYEGAAVGDNASGYARGLVAGDPFRGIAESQADNSAGSAGDINVRCITDGLVYLAVTSVAITDVGANVYASADGTFLLTAGSNSLIGKVYRYVSSGYAIVKLVTDEVAPPPAYVVVYAGEHTTVGTAASEDITVTGALATDLVLATLHTKGSSPVTLLTAVAAADKITITFSADPSTDHVLTYAVLRAIL